MGKTGPIEVHSENTTKAGIWVIFPQAKERQRWPVNHQKLRESLGHIFPSSLRRNQLCPHLGLGLLASRLERTTLLFNHIVWSFPGGSVVKKPLANAGDSGSIWSGKIPYAAGHLSPCVATTEAHAPVLNNKRSHPNEEPTLHN